MQALRVDVSVNVNRLSREDDCTEPTGYQVEEVLKYNILCRGMSDIVCIIS